MGQTPSQVALKSMSPGLMSGSLSKLQRSHRLHHYGIMQNPSGFCFLDPSLSPAHYSVTFGKTVKCLRVICTIRKNKRKNPSPPTSQLVLEPKGGLGKIQPLRNFHQILPASHASLIKAPNSLSRKSKFENAAGISRQVSYSILPPALSRPLPNSHTVPFYLLLCRKSRPCLAHPASMVTHGLYLHIACH